MHSIRLGWEEAVLNSEAIWLCIGCDTCSARCPQQVEPSSIMAAARLLAMQKGIQPRVREIGIYYQGFMYNMRLNGKIHDASLAGVTQLLSGQLIENLPLAWKLFKRGRVKLPLPPFGGGDFRRIYNNVIDKEKENKL